MKMLICGDFSPQAQMSFLFEKGEFDKVLGQVKNVTNRVEYSIVNFESCVPLDEEFPIHKIGPNLKCTSKSLEALKWAGFDCVTLANNHFLDYGENAVKNTLDICNKLNIDTVGGGMSLHKASKVFYKKLSGRTIGMINCCEHEYSIATQTTAGSNPLNPIQQYYAIKEARQKADYVLVIVHGGHEHYQLPSPRMKEIYRFFIDAGADVVINHHQHCFSGYEVYHEKPIFYGLGNFLFDKNLGMKDSWHYGNMLLLEFGDKFEFQLLPYEQCKKNIGLQMLDENAFDSTIIELNRIISDDELLLTHFRDYCKSYEYSSRFVLEPINNKYIKALQYKGLLPSAISKKWLLRLQNHIVCESHFDKFKYFLFNNQYLKK